MGTTQSGIHYFVADGNYCKAYYNQLNAEGGFHSAMVNHVVEDKNGIIWVAADGLYRYDETNDRFSQISLPKPFDKLNVFKLLAIDEVLWMLTELGLMRYHTEKGWLTDYSMIVETRFRNNLSAAHLIDNGQFVVGGENGLAVIDPNVLGFEHVFPRVFLTYMDFSDGTTLNGLSNYKEIRIGYRDNFLLFILVQMLGSLIVLTNSIINSKTLMINGLSFNKGSELPILPMFLPGIMFSGCEQAINSET